MKKFYALFLFIFIAFSFFAQDNNENPDESYYQLETKYFQIIYKKESIHTAKLLYENVDNFYEEITEKIDAKSDFFLPILIRSDIQALNAYFTFFPYDHIVIYDTVVDDLSLAVFSETLLSVFYHELTHAISLKSGHNSINLLNIPFIEVPNTLLTSPTSFSEGATVSFESSTGEGRLNSGYSLSVLLQAKLEDCFPDWKEASGANDKYRIGDYPYIFGGAFHKYLQEKYGMEKYKAFWNELNKRILTESAFKKVYNTSLTKEWALFKESIPTIEVEEDSGNIEVSKRKKINSFDATDNLIVYYSSSDRAINITKDEKEKKLLNAQSVVNLKLSSDEKYLAITKLSNLYAYETFIYDLENEKYLKTIFPPSEIQFLPLIKEENLLLD